MLVVMGLGASRRYTTTGKQAEAVPDMEGQPQPVIDQTLLAADVDRQSIALGHGHHLGVAPEPSRRARRKRRPAFDVAAPLARLAGEDADIHMYYNLRRCPRLDQAVGATGNHVLAHRD